MINRYKKIVHLLTLIYPLFQNGLYRLTIPYLRRLLHDNQLKIYTSELKKSIIARLLRTGNVKKTFSKEQLEPIITDSEAHQANSKVFLENCGDSGVYGRFGRRRIDDIYSYNSVCDAHLGYSLDVLEAMIEDLDRKEATTPFPKPADRCLKEALLVTLDYARTIDPLQIVLTRNYVENYSSPYRYLNVINEILKELVRANDVNFGNLASVLHDEASFAAAGFPGCVMAMDLKKIYLNGRPFLVLIGVNFHGNLRHIEILKGEGGEGEAVVNSDFFKEVVKPDFGKLHWPAGFRIKNSATTTTEVVPFVIFDQQFMAAFQSNMTPHLKLHIMTPFAWYVDRSKHDWVQKAHLNVLGQHLSNARWVVESAFSDHFNRFKNAIVIPGNTNLEHELAYHIFYFSFILKEIRKKFNIVHSLNADLMLKESIPLESMEPINFETMVERLLIAFAHGCNQTHRPLPTPKIRKDRLYIFNLYENYDIDPTLNKVIKLYKAPKAAIIRAIAQKQKHLDDLSRAMLNLEAVKNAKIM